MEAHFCIWDEKKDSVIRQIEVLVFLLPNDLVTQNNEKHSQYFVLSQASQSLKWHCILSTKDTNDRIYNRGETPNTFN